MTSESPLLAKSKSIENIPLDRIDGLGLGLFRSKISRIFRTFFIKTWRQKVMARLSLTSFWRRASRWERWGRRWGTIGSRPEVSRPSSRPSRLECSGSRRSRWASIRPTLRAARRTFGPSRSKSYESPGTKVFESATQWIVNTAIDGSTYPFSERTTL